MASLTVLVGGSGSTVGTSLSLTEVGTVIGFPIVGCTYL